ncbi:hypothetical protein [Halobellus salinisoli]|uniref:hypothetical protein n=1 Tax=Halobellus salinisoli TaxID=3108500 RepID=UPI00300B95C9
MAAATTRRRNRFAACALALVVILAGAVSVAAAADTTDLGVSPEADTLDSGATTEVDVIVENADDGVGAINATVTLSNPDVASIEDVTIHGDPGLDNVTERDDGVDVSAALVDTDDTGRVTVLTLVVRGESAGETAIDVNMRALGDEDGAAYTVADAERPTLTVDDASSSNDSDSSDSNSVEEPVDDSEDDSGADDSGDAADESSTGGSSESSGDDDSDASTGSGDGPAEAIPEELESGGNELSTDRFSTLYGPAGLLGIVAIGALAIYRFR